MKGPDRVVCGYIGRSEMGWETQVYKNNNLVIGRMFLLRAQAEALAADQRQQYEREGWKPAE